MDPSIVKAAADSLFTMSFTFDRQLTILQASDRLQKCCPLVRPGTRIEDAFAFHRPRGISSIEDIVAHKNALYLLIGHDASYALRGQVIYPTDPAGSTGIFLGSPWMSWLLDNHPDQALRLSDFPKHDAQMDQSFFIATQRASLRDLEELNEKLREARDEAKRAEQTRSAFFAVMSHEMRTPLNGVISAVNLLRDSTDRVEREKLLAITESSANNLLSVINYVLDYAKLEAKGLALEEGLFNLREAIGSVTDILHSKAVAKKIELRIVVAPDCPDWLEGDFSKLRQILINLAGNAVKFTEQGYVEIRVKCNAGDENRVSIVIEVEDTGVGIANEDLPHVFEAFWSSSNKTSSGDDNTGLGLSICSQLVELMKGEISLSSEPGRGSCFKVALPFTLANPDLSTTITNADQAVDLASRFKGHVLLVDDNQTNLLVGQLILEKLGVQVRTASDGEEAIQVASQTKFDVILMDISMPGMNGIEATEKLLSYGCQAPIVALTAHTGAAESRAFLDAGMQSILYKPLEQEALISELAKWLPRAADKPVLAAEFAQRVKIATPSLDSTRIDRLINMLGDEKARKMLRSFETEGSILVRNLLNAWVQRDLEQLAQYAHSLKGNALNLGADELADLMQQIEVASRDEDINQLVSQVTRINPVFTTVVEELSQRIAYEYP
jgi:signal transduction histidine kinase/DNA-binding response OmpR family regulator